MPKPSRDIFKLHVSQDGEDATIFLYNYIGKMPDWVSEERRKDEVTALGFSQLLMQLEKDGVRNLDVRMNTPGGSFHEGNPMITAIQRSNMDIVLHNDGMVASMGADIFFSVPIEKRSMAKNAQLMVHSALGSLIFAPAAEFDEMASVLRSYESTTMPNMTVAFGMSEDEIRANYYDGKDHYINYKQAVELGLVYDNADEEAEVEQSSRIDYSKMAYQDVIRHYLSPESTKKTTRKVVKTIEKGADDPAPIPEPKIEPIMTVKDLINNIGADAFQKQLVEYANGNGTFKTNLKADLAKQKTLNEQLSEMHEMMKSQGTEISKLSESNEALKAQNAEMAAKLNVTPAGDQGKVSKGTDPSQAAEPDDFMKNLAALNAAKKAELGVA